MKSQEFIEKIKEVKITPTTSDENKVLICFDVDKERKYFELETGKIVKATPDKAHLVVLEKKYFFRTYCQYIEELDSVACTLCRMDTRMPTKYTPRQWEVIDIFFITKNKSLVTKYEGEWTFFTKSQSKYAPFNLSDYEDINKDAYDYLNGNATSLYSAFKKLFNTVCIGTSDTMLIKSASELFKFLAQTEKKKSNGPKQKLIDELTSIELEPIDKKELTGVSHPYHVEKSLIEMYVKISQVKPGVCCLRYITKNVEIIPFKGVKSLYIFENVRIYIDKTSAIACKKNNDGEYVQLTMNSSSKNFKAHKILDFDKSILNDTMLQYFGSIFDELPEKLQSSAIWGFIQFPILEKLYKTGSSKIVMGALDGWGTSPIKRLELIYGPIDQKAKTLLKAIGVNKYQFNKVTKETKCNNQIIYNVKEILCTENIDYLDNDTFDILFELLDDAICMLPELVYVLKKLNILYSLKTIVLMKNKLAFLVKQVREYGYNYKSYIYIYKDYLDIVSKLNDTKNYSYKFENLEDIKEMHDAAVAVYNLKEEEYALKAFQSNMSRWKKFTYDKNEKYVVIAPTKPDDLAMEGITLHHCVKTYIDRVSNGTTNIVFIRKKDNVDKPFFTVEISNSNVIEQIHGFGNRNIDTEKGLNIFVEEWVKNNKLKISDIDKVR